MTDSPKVTLDQIRERFYSAVVCDALDEVGLRQQSPSGGFQNLSLNGVLAGRCRTTLWAEMSHIDPNPYALELEAIDACCPDDVFIAAAGGSMWSGIWGELLTTAARNGGCVGAIVDGAVRDISWIPALNFDVIARGTCPNDSQHRQRVIDVDVPVTIGGVVFAPGDLVIADRDGVVIVPQHIEQDVLGRAWKKLHAENDVRDAIAAGMKATEAYSKFGIL